MKIAVAGIGFVGLANAILLARQNEVVALDIVPEKVTLISYGQYWQDTEADIPMSQFVSLDESQVN